MSHKRADRVADLIKADMSRLLLRDVADPRIQNVTVTAVKVSDDLRFARIFFVQMGREGFKEETINGLRQATGFFKRELAKQMKLRYVPDIEFSFDESFDYGTRIDRLLNEIKKPMVDRVADAIRGAESILLTSHVRPDGDAVGSLLALYHALRYLEKEVVVFCQDKVPDIYGFLPGADAIVYSLGPVERFDTAVLLDCNETARIGDEMARVESIKTLIIIDHHISNNGGMPLSLIDVSASSTAEILVRLIDRLDVPLTDEIARNIYTALISDTGSFRYSNTGKETFLLAARLVEAGAEPAVIAGQVYDRRSPTSVRLISRALGTLRMSFDEKVGSIFLDQRTMEEEKALPEHAEGIIEMVRSIEGVMIAVMYFERKDGTYKVSFRSKGSYNVEEAAGAFGGGGHRNASACGMEGTLEEIRENVESVLVKTISEAEAAR